MSSQRFLPAFLITVCFASSPLVAKVTTIAITGENAVGIPLATWNAFDSATLNNDGDIAFGATLQHSGSIDATNDAGVWLFGSSGDLLLAQTGAGNVPGIGAADFETLARPQLSNSGEVIVNGTLVTGTNGITSTNNQGIWQFDNTSSSLLARTGSGNVAGVVNADFSGFPGAIGGSPVALANSGEAVFVGGLAPGVGGVLSTNDRGVWTYSSTNSALIAREGVFNVPDVSGANFNIFPLPAINSNGQLAVFASLRTGGTINSSNALGIWRYTSIGGELVARSGVGNVPGVAGADFLTFDPPRINDSGQIAFSGGLTNGDRGAWLYTGSTGSILALSDDGNVPGVAGADFSDVVVVSLNDAAQVLVSAELTVGVGGVTADDSEGLWLLNGTDLLVARSGSGGVPDLPGTSFSEFHTSSLNEHGQVAFAADLEMGVGGVDSTNDTGIWVVDPLGDSWLVAREGDQLAGQTVDSLSFVGEGASQASGFNDIGELVFQANFTSGDSGLFLWRPSTADFDRDGDVDSDDLDEWTTAYAITGGADADIDGDTDGTDFLAWQREFGDGVTLLTSVAAVPEPCTFVFALVGLAASCTFVRVSHNS